MLTLAELLAQNRPVVHDGATGTFLQQLGLPLNTAPETWVLENGALIFSAAEAYVNAGAQIILTCTFGGTEFRLRRARLDKHAETINRTAAQLAKEAAHGRAFVAGSLGPLGTVALKLGEIGYAEAVDQFAAQAHALAAGGADLFQIESMSDMQEMQAAIEGVRQVSPLPIFATLSFDSQGKTLLGITPTFAAKELAQLGCNAIGANCGHGVWDVAGIIREMRAAVANAVLIAKPNAGIPETRAGKLVYPVEPAKFAQFAREWVRAGAKIIGGCCGTTPEYIAAVRQEFESKPARDHRQMLIS